jgi:hypothetical protein
MELTKVLLVVIMSFLAFPGLAQSPARGQVSPETLVLDDFESYPSGGLPTNWRFVDGRQRIIAVTPDIMTEEEFFVVKREGNNQFVRAVTYDRAHRLLLFNRRQFDWKLDEYPRLSWRWRAIRLPEGAREDVEDKNDSGAAVYVTFSKDWLGRPRSIKYTYSSILPVGTVVSYGRLKVLVVSSGLNGTGRWERIERDVVQDYRELFGDDPPNEPISIMIWSDSNSVHDVSEVDFDDIELRAAS